MGPVALFRLGIRILVHCLVKQIDKWLNIVIWGNKRPTYGTLWINDKEGPPFEHFLSGACNYWVKVLPWAGELLSFAAWLQPS